MKTNLKTKCMMIAVVALMTFAVAPAAEASCHRTTPGCFVANPGYFPCPAGHTDEIGVVAHDDGLVEDTAWTGQVCEVTSSGEMFHLHHDEQGGHIPHLASLAI
ncbi:MAG: hypothetical protein A3B23_04065 [Candidatus Colwellbacteria bacterium RIFCSPLOWO2_01_FULL_48_10]|uniref:Peptidase M23 domain-containing protein n=1 Tax=Candidatus Colwellbacteria bacterium RIFCSPLOWO2_01_FULL_48_10 TaxID=1797690 RepID=A0A1G1Z3X9_9BACT|nr:MAG: hypothetical protein A3B23_04065 [Candidatus Colwellbacteria bacterium RIFCSPLOWO2_01_FULL_48_10]